MTQFTGGESRQRAAAMHLLLAAIIGIGFLPILVSRFALHNDWSFLAGDVRFPWWYRYPESDHLFIVGRPLGALLLNVQGLLVTSLGAMLASRFVAVAFILIAAWIMYRFLTGSLGASRFPATALAASIALLPPFELYAAWSTNLVPGALTVALSSALYLWLDRAWPDGPPTKPRADVIAIVVALVLLMSIYPPTALFSLVFTVARLLLDGASARRVAVRDWLVSAASMLGYFVAGKFVFIPAAISINPSFAEGLSVVDSIGYAFSVTTDLTAKIEFLAHYMGLVLSLTPGTVLGPWAAAGLAAIAILGWVAVARARLTRDNVGTVVVTALFVAATFLLSTAPVAAAKGDITGYRLAAASEAIWLLVVLAPLFYLPQDRFRAAAAALWTVVLLIQVGVSDYILERTALDCEREYNAFRTIVARAQNGTTLDLVVVLMPRGSQLLEPPLPYEFGLLSVNEGHVVGMLGAAVEDTGFKGGIRLDLLMGGDAPIDESLLASGALRPGVQLIDIRAARGT